MPGLPPAFFHRLHASVSVHEWTPPGTSTAPPLAVSLSASSNRQGGVGQIALRIRLSSL